MSREQILSARFLDDEDGCPITGRMIAQRFVDTYRDNPKKIIRSNHIHMRHLADFMRRRLHAVCPPLPAPDTKTVTSQADAFLATSALHALEVAGILMRDPYGYDRKLKRWLVYPDPYWRSEGVSDSRIVFVGSSRAPAARHVQ